MHDTPLSIEAQQQALIEEFSMLAEDYELLLTHLIDQGKTLPALNEEDKKEDVFGKRVFVSGLVACKS